MATVAGEGPPAHPRKQRSVRGSRGLALRAGQALDLGVREDTQQRNGSACRRKGSEWQRHARRQMNVFNP